jgi:hypothetical protein
MCLLMPHMFDITKLDGNSTRMNGPTLQCCGACHRHTTHGRSACKIARRPRLRTLCAIHRGHVRGAFRCKTLHGSSPRRWILAPLREHRCNRRYKLEAAGLQATQAIWLSFRPFAPRAATARSSSASSRFGSGARRVRAHARASRRPWRQAFHAPLPALALAGDHPSEAGRRGARHVPLRWWRRNYRVRDAYPCSVRSTIRLSSADSVRPSCWAIALKRCLVSTLTQAETCARPFMMEHIGTDSGWKPILQVDRVCAGSHVAGGVVGVPRYPNWVLRY